PVDAGWQQQTLSTAVATLGVESSSDPEKAAALRALRFLDTPESLRELVVRLGTKDYAWDATAGLAGSRDQRLVVQELERQMSAPDIGLSANYLYILAKLRTQLEHEPLPPYPQNDAAQRKIWEERAQKEWKDLERAQEEVFERAAALVPIKTGRAR